MTCVLPCVSLFVPHDVDEIQILLHVVADGSLSVYSIPFWGYTIADLPIVLMMKIWAVVIEGLLK